MNKNWYKKPDNLMLLLVLIVVLLTAMAYVIGNYKLLQISEPLILLPILYLFANRYFKVSLVLTGFLLFTSIAHLSSIFNIKTYGMEIEILAYCISYLCLIYEAISRIKKINFGFLISGYLILVFAINGFLLYSLYDSILKESITNNVELALVAVRVVSLLLFALFSFTVYLSTENRISILLLLMSISLVFSDVMLLVTEYYMYFWLFDFMGKTLYLITLYCFFLYIGAFTKLLAKTTAKKVIA